MGTEPRLVEVELEEPPQTVPTTAETRKTLIRLKHAKKLIRALLRGMHFDTDKAFLLPSAMKGIAMLRRFLAPRPRLSLLIVGHADTQGAAAHNLKLSEERARSIHHFLRDDVDAWLGFYGTPASSKPWGRIEDQHMLSALPGGGAPSFYAGPIHGKDDEPTKAAVKAFQRFSNETRGTTLSDDGICGPLTRKELVASYMGLDGQTLPAEVVVAMHGCGESHPEVTTGDDVALLENRRVEIFLFDGPATPPPVAPCPSPAGCAEYPKWREDTRFTIDLSQDPKDVTVKVRDDDGAIPEADVRLVGVDARAGKTDAAGTLLFAMVIPGEYEVAADKAGFHPNQVPLVVGGGSKAKAPAEAKPEAKSFADSPGEADAPAGDGGDAVVTLEARPGLTLFEIVSAPENSGILLDPKTRLPMVEPVPARPGPTPAVDKNATGTTALMVNHRPKGTTVRLRWATEGKVTVLLTIQRDGVAQFLDAQGQPRADLPPTVGPVVRGNDKVKTDGDRIVFDVTRLGDGKTKDDPATFDIVEDCLFTFDASLLVVDAAGDPDPTKRKPVARSYVRLMRKLQDPKILDMAVLNQRTGEKVTSFKDWRDLGFEFSLNDTSVGNDLVISGTIIKEGRPPTPAFTRETLKKADERRLRGASAPGQFAQFAPDVPAPYDLELDAELRPAGDHWPAKGTKVRIHFDPKQDQQPDLISIHEALALPNGSPIDLRGKAPVRSKAWVKTTTTAPVPAKGALDSPSNPVWSWTLEKDPQGGKVVVTDVRARVRDLHYAAYQVLERVEWEPVTITVKEKDSEKTKTVKLPYDPQFVLELTTAEDGFHGGDAPGLDQTGHYWKLQFHLDKSFQLVFGYEVIGETVRPFNRAPGADPLDAKLFPRCPSPAPAGTIAGSAKVADGEPLRVCVVVSLVTHRENSKFAPGDLLGAGRIYPYGLVLSNRELVKATHRVSTKRPDRTATPLAGVDGIVPSSCCIEMHEEMGAVLFTDNNVLRFPLIVGEVGPGVSLILEKLRNAAGTDLYNKLPMWNNFFDWYDTEPVNEDFRAVTRVATPATVPNAIGVLKFPKMIFLPGVGLKRLKDEEYARIDVLKVARQGEYDNIHQAPKMFMPSSVKTDAGNLKRFANAPEVGEPGKAGTTPMWGVEHVSMAPVCVHDCFHTHWRWSKDFDFQFTKGWGRGFNPYEVAGGALIPENQTLRVQFSGRGTLGLATAIHGVEAGRWQVANHFGSAYALHMNAPEEAVTNGINHAAELLEEPLLDGFPKFGLATSWARFYWRLRFGGTSTRPQERLKVTAAERTTLRLANLGPEES